MTAVSPEVIAISEDTSLAPTQALILSMFASMESFFADSGAPLTAAQVAALRSAEAEVRSGVWS